MNEIVTIENFEKGRRVKLTTEGIHNYGVTFSDKIGVLKNIESKEYFSVKWPGRRDYQWYVIENYKFLEYYDNPIEDIQLDIIILNDKLDLLENKLEL